MSRSMGSNPSARRLANYLNRLPREAQAAGLMEARSQARVLASAMRARIRRKSGVAASTISTGDHRSVVAGAAVTAGGSATAKKLRRGYGRYDYTRALEFGTRRHSTGLTGTGGLKGAIGRWTLRGGKSKRPRMHPGSKPFSFFWKTYRAKKTVIRRSIARAMSKAVTGQG